MSTETRCHVKAFHVASRAKDRLTVRRHVIQSGPLPHYVEPGQRRQDLDDPAGHLAEELPAGLGVEALRFIGVADAHDKAAMRTLLTIQVVVETHHHRVLHRFNRFGDEDFMPFGINRQLDADHPAQLFGIAASRHDYPWGTNSTPPGPDPGDPATFRFNPGHFAVCADLHAMALRRFRIRGSRLERIAVAVFGAEGRPQQPCRVQMRHDLFRFRRRHPTGWNPQRILQQQVLFELGRHFFRIGQQQIAALFQFDIDIDVQQLGQLFQHPGAFPRQQAVGFCAPLHPHAGAAAAGSAAGQVTAFQQHHFAGAEPGQIIGRGATDDAAADHHYIRCFIHPCHPRQAPPG